MRARVLPLLSGHKDQGRATISVRLLEEPFDFAEGIRCAPIRPALSKPGLAGASNGGGSEIRTHGTLANPAVFKTAALNHSAIPPGWGIG